MMTLRSMVAVAGCLAMGVSHAEPDIGSRWNAIQSVDMEPDIERVAVAEDFSGFTAFYRMSPNGGTMFGSVALPDEPASERPVSQMKRYAGIDDSDPAVTSRWLDSSYRRSSMLTLGYAWREVRVEGTVLAAKAVNEHRLPRNETPKLDARAARLSFNPSEHWLFQFSRGVLSGLDQMVAGGDLRRTAVSVTYQNLFDSGNWQTTLAWGRNTRKFQVPTTGYLLESTLRFSDTHILFGRMEQVSIDDLLLKDLESLRGLPFKVNKLTFGYFRDLPANGPLKLDIGVLGSRHLVPADVGSSYAHDPTSFMLFLRLNFR
jgi:hypothetical protein